LQAGSVVLQAGSVVLQAGSVVIFCHYRLGYI